MSLADAVAEDARGTVAQVAVGMDGVRRVEYREGAGGIFRSAESVVVTFDPCASGADVARVMVRVENQTDWVHNATAVVTAGGFGEAARLHFTRRWW